MTRPLSYCLAAAAVTAAAAAAAPADGGTGGFAGRIATWTSPAYRETVDRLRAAGEELDTLPVPAGSQSGDRSLGYHSPILTSPTDPVTVTVDLEQSRRVDLIALVPAQVESGQFAAKGYGFPRRFRVEVSDDPGFVAADVVADHGSADFPNPGPYPVVLEAGGRKARYVRVVCTAGYPRGTDWVVALGELYVLSGRTNVALRKPTECPRALRSYPKWLPFALVDGRTGLGLPVTREVSPTNGFLSGRVHAADHTKWVQVDLGHDLPVHEVRLIPARPTDLADEPAHGFPVRYRVELASDPECASGVALVDRTAIDIPGPGDNPVVVFGGGRSGRYVRVTATRLGGSGPTYALALAELEVYSRDRNVALGARVTAGDFFPPENSARWRPAFLVDGYSSQYRLLGDAEWLRGLDRARRLREELAALSAARAALAEEALGRAAWAAGGAGLGLAVASAAAVLWSRRQHRRALAELRRRIAGDLHDDIGSQLAAVGLICRQARHAGGLPPDADADLAEIDDIARETLQGLRDLVWLVHSGRETAADLLLRLREAARHQLEGVAVEFHADDPPPGLRLGIELRRHALLWWKEALHNVAEHSKAARARLEVRFGRRLRLVVADEGVGFDPAAAAGGNGLTNLRWRAGQLGGGCRVESSPGGGTRVELDVPLAGGRAG